MSGQMLKALPNPTFNPAKVECYPSQSVLLCICVSDYMRLIVYTEVMEWFVKEHTSEVRTWNKWKYKYADINKIGV